MRSSSFTSFAFGFQVCNTTTDRNHADPALEKYVTETVMAIVKGFFSSPFSVNHSNLQVLFSTSDSLFDVPAEGGFAHITSESSANFELLYSKIFDSRSTSCANLPSA